jgi:hypothetical protein
MLTPYSKPALPSLGTFWLPVPPEILVSFLKSIGKVVNGCVLRRNEGVEGSATFFDITLDHDTHDSLFAIGNLFGQDGGHLWLVSMVFE